MAAQLEREFLGDANSNSSFNWYEFVSLKNEKEDIGCYFIVKAA